MASRLSASVSCLSSNCVLYSDTVVHMELMSTHVGFLGSYESPDSLYPALMPPKCGTSMVVVAAMSSVSVFLALCYFVSRLKTWRLCFVYVCVSVSLRELSGGVRQGVNEDLLRLGLGEWDTKREPFSPAGATATTLLIFAEFARIGGNTSHYSADL